MPESPLVAAVPALETAAPRPVRRRGLLLAAVVVMSMLVGAGAATGVLFAVGWPGEPEHRFSVNVYLKSDVTAAQKSALQAALPAFHPTGGIRFETRQEAWQHMREMAKDEPSLLNTMKEENMPESFRLETRGRSFDCTGFTKVRPMPGVQQIQVIQQRLNGYGATIVCDAEYANP